MKNTICILTVCMLLFSCKKDLIEKPDNLIGKEKMKNILYDMAILNSARSVDAKILSSNNVLPKQYLYKKYNIDSTVFSNSNLYYVSHPQDLEEIYTEIHERLKTEKDSINKRILKERELKDSISKLKRKQKDNPISLDSLKAASKKMPMSAAQ